MTQSYTIKQIIILSFAIDNSGVTKLECDCKIYNLLFAEMFYLILSIIYC